jgi:hypothetical protein
MPRSANDAHDKVRVFQRKLYRAAKQQPGRRFHALYDKIHRKDVLERAWKEVAAHGGAAGVAPARGPTPRGPSVATAQFCTFSVRRGSRRWRRDLLNA